MEENGSGAEDIGLMRVASLAAILERRARERPRFMGQPSLEDVVKEINATFNLLERGRTPEKS